MAEQHPKSKFLTELARANTVLVDHLPAPPMEEVFCGTPGTLRESLEVLYREIPERETGSELAAALTRLTLLCAVMEHLIVMARICRPR